MASNVVDGIVAAVKHLTHTDAGHQALRALDAILAMEPKADTGLFSQCTRNLAILRNELIGQLREPDAGDDVRTGLTHVNAIISVVLAGHFPLGPVPWDELHKARGWLADLVGHVA